MHTRRDVLRAMAMAVAATATPPAGAAESGPRIVSPYLEGGLTPGLGLWTRHAGPDARLALPGRVHALAHHPRTASCVAVARRPGRFAIAVDLMRFEQSAAFESANGRHFFGHGLFAEDGRLFLTTENDIERGEGVIGLRDPARDFRSVGEWRTHGVGPHDLALSQDGRLLFVANGGLDTTPDTGRARLNEGRLRSFIAAIDMRSGRLAARIDLGEDMASLSIRHLAMLDHGLVFGCQDTAHDGETRPLVGHAAVNGMVRWFDPPLGGWPRFAGYVGDIAVDKTGRIAAATSPLGSACALWEIATGRCLRSFDVADGCAIGSLASAFVIGGGHGALLRADESGAKTLVQSAFGFDNHLIVAL